MKIGKGIIFVSLLLIFFSVFAGCNQTDHDIELKNSNYRFEDYESDQVFDIEKVNLSWQLAEKCVTYKFTYLSDGYKIKAYISIPVSAIDSQQPSKCILYNRGGNSNIGLLDDNTTANYSAMCDRVVIASQYRGADGSEGKDQFGGEDLNDVIKLIDLCESEFSFIDMDDFCAVGESRGSIMTYMAARQDDRIKRIISVSGVSDLFQEYDNREDMQKLLFNYIGYTPQEKPAEYEKRSAIYWYDEIKIPVLIIHSTGDKQASYQEANELYEKMKETTECTLITREDDVHGLGREDVESIIYWLNNK